MLVVGVLREERVQAHGRDLTGDDRWRRCFRCVHRDSHVPQTENKLITLIHGSQFPACSAISPEIPC